MARRQDPLPSALELGEVVPQFLGEYRYSGSPKTYLYYHDHVARSFATFARAQGIAVLADVTPAQIRQWLEQEAGRVSPTTVHHRHQALSRFFRWCEEQDHLPHGTSPMRRVRRPSLPIPSRVGFTREEARKLVHEAGKAPGWLGYRDRAIVLTLLGCGLRANELLTMQLDWPHHRVKVLGKGSKWRSVPMGPRVSRALKDYLRHRPQIEADALWLTQRRTPLGYSTLNAMLGHLGDYAGVADVTPHRFRHTYAAEWYREHRDIMALKNLLGHSKVEVTQRYLRSLGLEYGTGDEFSTPDTWLG